MQNTTSLFSSFADAGQTNITITIFNHSISKICIKGEIKSLIKTCLRMKINVYNLIILIIALPKFVCFIDNV